MKQYVAFLRAINVGGRAMVTMADLEATFRRAGGRRVGTILQSGNVLFEAPARDVAGIVGRAKQALRRRLGAEPEIVVRSASEIEAIVAGAPFRNADYPRPVKLYVAFLLRTPKAAPDLPLISSTEALEVTRIDAREAFIVSRPKRTGFFGFPNNFIEAQLGVAATTRNWSTVTKIANRSRPPGRP